MSRGCSALIVPILVSSTCPEQRTLMCHRTPKDNSRKSGKVYTVCRLQPGQSFRRPPSTTHSRKVSFLLVGSSDSTNFSGFYSPHRERLVVEGPQERAQNGRPARGQQPAAMASLAVCVLTIKTKRGHSGEGIRPWHDITGWRATVSRDWERQPGLGSPHLLAVGGLWGRMEWAASTDIRSH